MEVKYHYDAQVPFPEMIERDECGLISLSKEEWIPIIRFFMHENTRFNCFGYFAPGTDIIELHAAFWEICGPWHVNSYLAFLWLFVEAALLDFRPDKPSFLVRLEQLKDLHEKGLTDETQGANIDWLEYLSHGACAYREDHVDEDLMFKVAEGLGSMWIHKTELWSEEMEDCFTEALFPISFDYILQHLVHIKHFPSWFSPPCDGSEYGDNFSPDHYMQAMGELMEKGIEIVCGKGFFVPAEQENKKLKK